MSIATPSKIIEISSRVTELDLIPFKMELSDQTELVLSYEHANHERYIDRGIPTGADGKPVKSLDGITFGGEDENIQTLKADIFKGTFDTSSLILLRVR